MTFDDDFIRIKFTGGVRTYFLKQLGLEWPPPPELDFHGFFLKRVSFSSLTDEQRAGMTHVCRGAEYEPMEQSEVQDVGA